jgi:replicative DNA helicase
MMNQTIPLTIPNDIEAEKAILGAILQDNKLINKITGTLKPNSFYNLSNQHIFGAMLDLVDAKQPIDPVLLGDQLLSSKQLEESGGYVYLEELIDCAPSSGNITHYAKITQEHALLRDLISTTTEIGRKSRNPENNVSELLIEAEHKIRQISLGTNKKNYSSIKNLLAKNFERLEKVSETNDEITGMATGLIELDRYLAGLQDSDLLIIGARPSMGKTALALNIAAHVTTKKVAKGSVLIFNLEMSKEQVSFRILTSESEVDGKKLKTGNLEQEDWDKLAMATDRISSAKIFINDSTNITPQELTAITKQLDNEEENGVSLVIVDYLQLMKGSRPNMPREQEIAEISRSLKALAKDLNIPVIALSQLNRSLESRTDKRPKLSDLRESGAIEQDADIILFIYRDEVYNEDNNSKTPKRGNRKVSTCFHR